MTDKAHHTKHISADKSNTLLLIAACISVLLPHFWHVHLWVSIACTLTLGWRIWLTLSGRRLPPMWLLLPVCLLMMAGIFLSFRTFFGKEAGVTMLVLLLACKLLEMHAKRDLFVVLFLAFFLLLTSYFYQQTIGVALLSLCAVGLLLSAQISFQYTGILPPLRQRLRAGFSMLGLALPLMLCAFFLFPRIQGPLWGLPGDAGQGRSGLSNSMTPGGISNLVLSEEIAFRVKFDQAPPIKNLQYWRGIVMTDYDGKTWTPGRRYQHDASQLVVTGQPMRQLIILEPHSQHWLFALELSQHNPRFTDGTDSVMNNVSELRSRTALQQRIRYEVESYPDFRLDAQADLQDMASELSLPVGFNPRTQAYARELRQQQGSHQAYIQAVLQHFRQQNFIYTLEPARLGRDAIDDFLFSTRAGFCEHYASAFVVLMRAAGIPARIVTGYQGGNLNTVDGYFEVRQSDAHAWAEVWLSGQGWTRVDPTAAVAPERVMQNLSRALPASGLAGLVNLALQGNSFSQALRMQWDAMNNNWNQWVLNYNQQGQQSLLSKLGWKDVDWVQMTWILFLAGSLILGVISLPLLLNKPAIPALDRVYFSFCHRMARKALPRKPHEGPQAYLLRLQARLAPEEWHRAKAFIDYYSLCCYGKQAGSDAASLKQLKQLLSACK